LKKVFCGAGMLAVCSILAKFIGAFYRIPLTNILGSEGIGIHHMVFPLYTVLITVSSGGAPIAIARLIAANGADKKIANRIFRIAVISLIVLGGIASAIIIALCRVFAKMQGNELATIAYLGIAPAIFFVALVSAYRGYFQGMQNLLPPSLSQMVEQIVKVIVGLGLSTFMLRFGVEYGVLGGLIGISVAEFASLTLLFVSKLCYKPKGKAGQRQEEQEEVEEHKKVEDSSQEFAKDKRILATEVAIDMDFAELANPKENSLDTDGKDSKNADLSTKNILKQLFKVALPVTIGALILPISQLLDSVIVIRFLMASGFDNKMATSQFGVINGPVSSLINMPVVITMALSVALMPKIASNLRDEKKEKVGIKKEVFLNYRFACLFSVFVAINFVLFANQIMNLLYSKGLSGDEMVQGVQLLRISGILVVYIGLLQISTAVLQGVGKPALPTIFLGIGALLKCIVGYTLMIWFGIFGIVIATVVFYFVATLLNTIYIKRKKVFSIADRQFFVKLVINVLVSVTIGIILQLVLSPLLSNLLSLLLCGLIVLVVFGAITLATKTFSFKECKELIGLK